MLDPQREMVVDVFPEEAARVRRVSRRISETRQMLTLKNGRSSPPTAPTSTAPSTPYDLMNTSLKPGVRKLPSALDLSILNTIWSNKPTTSQQINTTANLTAGALIGITNGSITLTEQSQKLSELTQAFIIPTGAKTLQFTIKDNHLVTGDTTKTANDAFEVALLDTNTFNPLAETTLHHRTDNRL